MTPATFAELRDNRTALISAQEFPAWPSTPEAREALRRRNETRRALIGMIDALIMAHITERANVA
jgi:hypothetical protein